MNIVFDHTQSRDEVERTMTDYVNSNRVPLRLSVPTILHYNELYESRMFMSYHPNKVGEVIHGVLESLGEERDWKAGVCFDYKSGFTHVFFGKSRYMAEFPQIFMRAVIGTV